MQYLGDFAHSKIELEYCPSCSTRPCAQNDHLLIRYSCINTSKKESINNKNFTCYFGQTYQTRRHSISTGGLLQHCPSFVYYGLHTGQFLCLKLSGKSLDVKESFVIGIRTSHM